MITTDLPPVDVVRLLRCDTCTATLGARTDDPSERIEHNADGSHTWFPPDTEVQQ